MKAVFGHNWMTPSETVLEAAAVRWRWDPGRLQPRVSVREYAPSSSSLREHAVSARARCGTEYTSSLAYSRPRACGIRGSFSIAVRGDDVPLW